MKLDDGNVVRFGQDLAEIEKLYSCKGIDNPLRIARKSIDQLIQISNVTFEFDTGRLKGIIFKDGYRFSNPPTPYPENWKNFFASSEYRMFRQMPRSEFLSYLAVWEARATVSGAEKVHFGDLSPSQYSVSIDRERYCDMVHVSMGPSRRSGGGGIWCDGWTAIFKMDKGSTDANSAPLDGALESLSVFRDEFNTVARRR
jgi:hypothetical protein